MVLHQNPYRIPGSNPVLLKIHSDFRNFFADLPIGEGLPALVTEDLECRVIRETGGIGSKLLEEI
jgi:hypothetical protein